MLVGTYQTEKKTRCSCWHKTLLRCHEATMLKIVTQRTYSLFALGATEQLRSPYPSSPCRDLALSVDGSLSNSYRFGKAETIQFLTLSLHALLCAPLDRQYVILALPWILNWPIRRRETLLILDTLFIHNVKQISARGIILVDKQTNHDDRRRKFLKYRSLFMKLGIAASTRLQFFKVFALLST